MLKLSPRHDEAALPAWARRESVTRDDLRMHWAGRQAFSAEPGALNERTEQSSPIDRMRSTPRRQRAEALVLTLARYRCACCGSHASAVRERRGAPVGACDIHDLEPVCARCNISAGSDPGRGPDGSPMAGVVADVMARFRPIASSA